MAHRRMLTTDHRRALFALPVDEVLRPEERRGSSGSAQRG
jgi:hypothetical protein